MKVQTGSLVARLDGVDFPLRGDGLRFQQFETEAPADYLVSLSFGDAPVSEWRVSERLGESWNPKAGVLEVKVTEWDASFSLRANRVRASLPGRWPRAVDSLLATSSQIFSITTGRAVFFHAACVERNGKAFMFLGRSGAGKTTAAFLSVEAGARVLAEEMTCVCGLDAEGALKVATLPFRQRGGTLVSPLVLPLERILVLNQSNCDRVTKLSRSAELSALARCATIGSRHPLMMSAAFGLVRRIAEMAEIRLLEFRKSSEFWHAVDDDLGAK